LAALTADCRTAWLALGKVAYGAQASERSGIVFRRSLYAVRNIAPGEALTRDNVRSIRPGFGLPPVDLPRVLGRRAAAAIPRGTPLGWDLLQ
jgi:N-acetylneuraminate synthase